VTVAELLEKQSELDALLQKVGPVQFIRELFTQLGATSLHSQGVENVSPSKRATKFEYADDAGAKARVIVFSELTNTGRSRYTLQCEAMPE
jgi:hypothetical protein